jgi:hypothetical protein
LWHKETQVAARDWAELEAALDEAGASRDEFIDAARIVLLDGLRRAPSDDPASLFAAAEAGVLRAAGFSLEARSPGEPDVVARTAAEGAVIVAEAKTAAQVARAMAVTASRVRQRAVDRTLVAIRGGDEWRFPSWQFLPETGKEIRGLAVVVRAMPPGLHPLAMYRFMTQPNPDLDVDDQPVSPIAWLIAGGDPEPVAQLAAGL